MTSTPKAHDPFGAFGLKRPTAVQPAAQPTAESSPGEESSRGEATTAQAEPTALAVESRTAPGAPEPSNTGTAGGSKKRRGPRPVAPAAARERRLQTKVRRRTDELLHAAMAEKRARGLSGRAADKTTCLEEAVEATFGHLLPKE